MSGRTWIFKSTKISRFGPTQSEATELYKNTNVKVKIIGQGIQEWTIPQSGIYRIDAYGAQGASTIEGCIGGKGAYISSMFSFGKGERLYILIGQTPPSAINSWGGGGGGGTFVAKYVNSSNDILLPKEDKIPIELLIAASGGGGSGDTGCAENKNGDSGLASYSEEGIGTNHEDKSSGGSGYRTDALHGTLSFLNGGIGGTISSSGSGTAYGGFGGGGAPYSVGGGGGGYKGGDTGKPSNNINEGYAGKGGYSFFSGYKRSNKSGINSGNGRVKLTLIELTFCYSTRHNLLYSSLLCLVLICS